MQELILKYLSQGYTQYEIADKLKLDGIKPNSVSSIEKMIHKMKQQHKARTNFHLAIVLFGNIARDMSDF